MPTIKASDENATIGSFTPPGVVQPFAGSTSPAGWLLCDGAPVSRPIANGGTVDTYKALYDAVGTTWGVGNGTTTFNIPDFRGMFLRGTGSNGIKKMSDGSTYFDGSTLGTYQEDRIQSHGHGTLGAYDTGGSNYGSMTTSIGNSLNRYSGATYNFQEAGSAGPVRSGLDTKPASYSINYIIKY